MINLCINVIAGDNCCDGNSSSSSSSIKSFSLFVLIAKPVDWRRVTVYVVFYAVIAESRLFSARLPPAQTTGNTASTAAAALPLPRSVLLQRLVFFTTATDGGAGPSDRLDVIRTRLRGIRSILDKAGSMRQQRKPSDCGSHNQMLQTFTAWM